MDALDVIVEQTDDKVSQLKDYLSEGRAESFEEYKRICGDRSLGFIVVRGAPHPTINAKRGRDIATRKSNQRLAFEGVNAKRWRLLVHR